MILLRTRLRVEVEPSLAEAAVRAAVPSGGGSGDAELAGLYRADCEDLYRLPAGEERERRAAAIHREWFRRLGLAAPFEETLEAFPALRGRVGPILVARAAHAGAEGADLPGPLRETAVTLPVGFRVLERRLLDPTALRDLLLHEWGHVEDLLDPGFGYEGPGALDSLPAARRNVVGDRYGELWCLCVDARLARRGVLGSGAGALAERERAVARLWPSLPEEARGALLRAIQERERFRHGDLLAVALDPSRAAEILGVPAAAAEGPPPPGSPCPLCRFPTHEWRWGASLGEETAGRVRRDHPGWEAPEGICSRCYDRYALAARLGGAP